MTITAEKIKGEFPLTQDNSEKLIRVWNTAVNYEDAAFKLGISKKRVMHCVAYLRKLKIPMVKKAYSGGRPPLNIGVLTTLAQQV